MALQDQVSDNVRVLAAARGTTPAAVAIGLGKSRQWIQAKMAGRNRWYLDDVEALARALDVEVEQMLGKAWWPVLRPRQDSNLQPTDLWADASDLCACGHPAGWHYRSLGSCLECLCLDYRRPTDLRSAWGLAA